jgi:serine/threonine-protein kinase
MAPEAMTAPETSDARADVYAVGAVAYFLLTGKAVFEADSVLEVCSKHMWEQPVPPSELRGKPVSSDLEALVLACLAKERDARPQSAAALRAALLECEDAKHYDRQASRVWWNGRGAELRASKLAGNSAPSPPSTMTRADLAPTSPV